MAAGRPGPALTVGIPLVILAAGGYFGYTKFIKPAMDEKESKAKEEKLGKSTSLSGKQYGTMIKMAGDPWSGYSTFRKEPQLEQELAKSDIGIAYFDDEKYYDQNERMKALAAGDLDVVLTTVDAFLQHGAKHKKDGLYPGVIIWGIDESNGGDAIFLSKDKKSFDDVKPSDKVCYSAGTPSEHLWDFASLSFTALESVKADAGVVAKDCWEKLEKGEVQVAVLWQPFTAIAEKAGYPKVFATGGQADDVIVDVAVANRDYVIKNKGALEKLTQSYFKVIDGYLKDPAAHGKFITADCGPDCNGDQALGTAVLKGIDFLDYQENMCLWWGQCGKPAKMVDRIGRTGRLLQAKNKLSAGDMPKPADVLNDSFLLTIKSAMDMKAKLAAEVAGKDSKEAEAKLEAKEKEYTYAAEKAKDDKSATIGTLNLPSIYFQEGKASLDPNAESVVDTIGDRLKSFPALCVHVWGHTNSVGNAASNKTLSEKRAKSIVEYLQQRDASSFPASRFDVRGFGSEQPVMKDGVEDKNASRRTEFKLFNCN
ncbi:MAG: OmpA family protein [Myxococcales bacterium]|nr:OmpA family protein [Myxococcales bacterium]